MRLKFLIFIFVVNTKNAFLATREFSFTLKTSYWIKLPEWLSDSAALCAASTSPNTAMVQKVISIEHINHSTAKSFSCLVELTKLILMKYR